MIPGTAIVIIEKIGGGIINQQSCGGLRDIVPAFSTHTGYE
jgi:hypothetical protein